MKEMDYSESVELFSWYVFQQASPRKDFAELTSKVVAYCGGLPLALVVLGFELHGKEKTDWEKLLDKLKRHPHPLVQQNLKISFDGLCDANEKDIFLDIAYFFLGKDQNDVMQALNDCGLDAKTGISILVKRSLVTIDQESKLRMHVLLRDMGREIIHERSTKKPKPGIYDAFLSFRGEDTRAKFIAHLYSSLETAGFYVFKDDVTLPRGDRVSISLQQAIERSRISIIVFSENYANSRWCMVELEKIMDRHITTSHVVLPVFYNVKPSDVRHLTGMFGRAFEDLLGMISLEEDRVQRWKRALFEVGGISGNVIINSRNENKDINEVVEEVTRLLDKTELFVANHPVGVESCVQDLIQRLKKQKPEDILLLGICGMGGIGKTTIAKALYNEIGCKFERRSFLLNIREVWEQYPARADLQNQLLSDIYKTMKIKIRNVESGKSILQEKLPLEKILLVLDDMNKLDKSNALFGNRKWFCPGSIIIITTRNEDLLRVLEVNEVYRVKEMNETESLELLSWHAFKQASPREDFDKLAKNVVNYCGGLPLALGVLGSHLFEKGIKEWGMVLEKLKIIPNHEVIEKLKISYDGLGDDIVKRIFLDISFFFIGMDKDDVTQILNDCGLFADDGISVLVDRSLMTVDNNKLRMHGLLQDMGREIVRQESPIVLEKRSRLWVQEEVIDVLSKHTGTNTIEGLTLQLPKDTTISLETKAFKNMKKLRLLQLAGVQFDGDFKYLSRDLRWLCWHEFPATGMSRHFCLQNLIAIELEYSNLTRAWEKDEIQLLNKLKILNFSHSFDLTQTPDFSYLPNLEKLVFKDCPRLSQVSDTIGSLNKLLLMNLEDCTSLCNLPRSFYQLTSLDTLNISGCSKIDKLEEDIEQMASLTTLIADNTAIRQLPEALVKFKGNSYICVCDYRGSFDKLPPSLIASGKSTGNTDLSLAQTSVAMSPLVSTCLPVLQSLQVECSSELTKKLEAMPSTSQVSNIKASALIDCCSEVHISGSNISFKSLLIQMGMNCQATNKLRETILQKLKSMGPGDCLLPGDNDPNWRTFDGEGSSVNFEVPEVIGRKLKKMMLCIVCSSSPNITTSEGLKNVLIINDTNNTSQVFRRDALTSFEEEKWQSVISNLGPGNKLEVCVGFDNGFIVEKTTVYLIYDESIDTNRSGDGTFTLSSLLAAVAAVLGRCCHFGLVSEPS